MHKSNTPGNAGPATPGRPKDSGSRQQTQPDQNIQTGSPELDKEAAGRGNAPEVPVKPTGIK